MTEEPLIRVLTVDDHPLFREGIAAILQDQRDMILVAQASTATEAIQSHRNHKPDVTLMDLRLPDRNGIETLRAILSETPGARIVVLTTFATDVEIQIALDAGARAYLLKNMPPHELFETIRQVHAGKICVPANLAVHPLDRSSKPSPKESLLSKIKRFFSRE
jgi:DNA-binding NarL/FixJ family response regulator